MTATAVIEEIKQLPRPEPSRVIRLALELASSRRLPGDALAELVSRIQCVSRLEDDCRGTNFNRGIRGIRGRKRH